jgi:hypothetical protein
MEEQEQKIPRHMRPSPSLHMDRINICVRMLADGHRKSAIKRALRNQFEVKTARTAERYVAIARKILCQEGSTSLDELRAYNLEKLRQFLRDPKADPADCLRAIEIINKMLGLNEPSIVHQHVSGKTEQKIVVEYVGDEWRDRVEAQMPPFDLNLEEATGANSSDN